MSNSITDLESLEQHFDAPLDIAVAVERKSLDKFQQQFIQLSPFACVATTDSDGIPTISPRGDAPGFIRIIDDSTLLVPDRPGNNKVESFHNLLENPGIAVIFMIPGVRETLRVKGHAEISTSGSMLDDSRVGRNPVRTGLKIKINKVYFHCGKAMIRSKLWEDTYRPAAGVLPTFAEIIKAEAELDAPRQALEDKLEHAYTDELY